MKNKKNQWLLVLSLSVLCLVACKERNTHYDYYANDITKPYKVYEVDKESGKMDGFYKEFYVKGALMVEGSYSNGKKDGTFREYLENGKLMMEKYWEDGKMIGKKSFEEPAVNVSYFKDPRDNQSYPIVTIGQQVWMASNLNYDSYDSYCYDDNPSNCKKYGRLYSWEASLKVCPSGWHLPSYEEFETLFAAVGEFVREGDDWTWFNVSLNLKSRTGWKSGYGTNAFGFSILPAGGWYNRGNWYYLDEGESALFWCYVKKYSRGVVYGVSVSSEDRVYFDRGFIGETERRSVRCLKD